MQICCLSHLKLLATEGKMKVQGHYYNKQSQSLMLTSVFLCLNLL